MGLAAGVNAALALRLLGAAPRIPVGEFRRFVPFMWFGFWLNAASGLALFIAYPTKAITNPVFWVKLAFIACAMCVFVRLRRRLFPLDEAVVRSVRLPLSLKLRRTAVALAEAGQPDVLGNNTLAVVSLTCWAGAIFAGRFLAYTYTRLMADW